jgi:hypothetical protein
LIEIVSLCDTPAGVSHSVARVAAHQVGAGGVSVLGRFFPPDEHRTVPTDCIDLKILLSVSRSGNTRVTCGLLISGECCCKNSVSMPSKCLWSVAF